MDLLDVSAVSNDLFDMFFWRAELLAMRSLAFGLLATDLDPEARDPTLIFDGDLATYCFVTSVTSASYWLLSSLSASPYCTCFFACFFASVSYIFAIIVSSGTPMFNARSLIMIFFYLTISSVVSLSMCLKCCLGTLRHSLSSSISFSLCLIFFSSKILTVSWVSISYITKSRYFLNSTYFYLTYSMYSSLIWAIRF